MAASDFQNPTRYSCEHGVTMLEFAIGIPIFFLLVFAIIDMSSYGAIRGVTDEALRRSLEVATTVPNLDHDATKLNNTSVEYRRLALARIKVSEAGEKFLTSLKLISLQPDGDSVQQSRLLDLRFTELVRGQPIITTSKILVLRPGECLEVPQMNGQIECNRATLGTTAAELPPKQPMKFLLERHPIKVVAYVRFSGYTPFLFSAILRREAYAYRQPIPQGPFPAWEDPGLAGGSQTYTPPPALPPIGEAELPTEPPRSCVPNWHATITAAIDQKVAQNPVLSAPNDPVTGFCPFETTNLGN
jgi:hypothetical protein